CWSRKSGAGSPTLSSGPATGSGLPRMLTVRWAMACPSSGSDRDALRRARLLGADPGDLAVAVAAEALPVAGQLRVGLLDVLGRLGLPEGVLVEDLALGDPGLVALPDLGDGCLLGLGQWSLRGAALLVLLAQPLHGQLVGRLGAVAAHGR